VGADRNLGERELVRALREGDEGAFARLVDELGPALLRLARTYVRSQAVAEEVVQEAWLGGLRGLDAFEERASLRTWIFRILANTAKTRAVREARTVPLSSLEGGEDDDGGPAVDPDRFVSASAEDGHWVSTPRRFSELPEERLLARETTDVVRGAIDALPATQRAVISLRDIEGWSSEEVRNVLDLSETNQRVLLHRARSRVRQALEDYLAEE
jgi:RNA polymerase sigma-70 factor (ECF subfamily)